MKFLFRGFHQYDRTLTNVSDMTQKDFHISSGDQPHIDRCKEILQKHPEVPTLMGRNSYTFLILLFLVGLQTGIAIWMGMLGTGYWWLSLVVARQLNNVLTKIIPSGMEKELDSLGCPSCIWAIS